MFLTVKNSLKMLRTLDCNKTSKKNDKNIYEVKKGDLQQWDNKAPAKRSQHFNKTYRNIIERNATYCARLATLLRRVATCCDMLRHVRCCWLKFENDQIFHATFVDIAWCCSRLARFVQRCCARARALVRFLTPNISQHVANRVAKRAQHVAPNNVAICCLQVSRSLGRSLNCKCWANNVGICCVEMLRSFGWGLKQY